MLTSVRFGCSIAIIVFVSCGARTGMDDGATRLAVPAGGASSWEGGSPLLTGGGGSSGGSATTGTDIIETYCNGIFAKKVCGLTRNNGVDGSFSILLARACDIELSSTPASGADRLVVVVDCNQLSLVLDTTPDVGGANGFYIDYTHSPAHLRLTGSYCNAAQAGGISSIDVMIICGTTSLHGCACRG
jgi:hypothetical protein